MTLVGLLVLLLVVGIVLAFVPIDPQIRRLVIIILVVLFCLWLLFALGVFGDGIVVREPVRVVR